ncbi:hypothetical protein MNBD_NITROSPINAE02-755 [hydrothermal vent metagenome]|uniref:Sulfur carrier protein ThiS n=1 Tax=hydrothermal vent metagenome TaxID=652676 RepID=A0A3B1CT93_9ZZZZ
MNIILNGQPTDISEGQVLLDLVKLLNLEGPVAAQVNEDIIAFDELEKRLLSEGDKVELFRMMGGG